MDKCALTSVGNRIGLGQNIGIETMSNEKNVLEVTIGTNPEESYTLS